MEPPPSSLTISTPTSEQGSRQPLPFPDQPDSRPVTPETIKPSEGPARPYFYVSRGNGRFVPLIAVDELPPYVKIRGLATSASFKDIVDVGGHPLLPALEQSRDFYIVDNVDENGLMTPASFNTESLSQGETGSSQMVPSNTAITTRLANALEGVGEFTNTESLKEAILNTTSQAGGKRSTSKHGATQSYNPTTPGVLGKKVYCTHWMRTGECDFTQQGCMFLHRMPDLDTLELLGFRTYPRWFREMPRDFQVKNSKDFNPLALEESTAQRASSAKGRLDKSNFGSTFQNYNPGNRYNPPRGPQSATTCNLPPAGPSSHFIPDYRIVPGRPGFSHGFHTVSAPPVSNLPFSQGQLGRSFTSSTAMHHTDTALAIRNPGQSIWSRDESPMSTVNRAYAPLEPQVGAGRQSQNTFVDQTPVLSQTLPGPITRYVPTPQASRANSLVSSNNQLSQENRLLNRQAGALRNAALVNIENSMNGQQVGRRRARRHTRSKKSLSEAGGDVAGDDKTTVNNGEVPSSA